MKIASFLLLFTLLHGAATGQVQKFWGDPHEIEKFRLEAIKDPSYNKLRSDAAALSKKAKGSMTNANAARALFNGNSSLLNALYKKFNIQAPKPMNASRPAKYSLPLTRAHVSKLSGKYQYLNPNHTKIVIPPYKNSWRWMNQAGSPSSFILPDTGASAFAIGKTVLVYETPVSDYAVRTGQYFQGFVKQFNVPADPLVIAAEIKFEYSYLYTGWDTYGARLGMDLLVEAVNINGPTYTALEDYDAYGYSYGHNWKRATTLYPADTIDTDFGEFHGSGNSSYTIEGYVTPGAVIDVNFGFGFIKGAARGINGSYHYAEFILKKITIKYLKNGN